MKISLSALMLSSAALFGGSALANDELNAHVEAMNAELAPEGLVIHSVEWITASGTEQLGKTVFFSDNGNKQTASHFVPGDTRIGRDGRTDITYVTDLVDGATSNGLSELVTLDAINAAMTTWDDVNCSDLPVNDLGAYYFDYGYVQYLLGFGGVAGWAADITHAGFLPGAFFDVIAPGGGASILGVTFTLNFVGGDTNGDGLDDVAFREIYYNDAFDWSVDGSPGIDVETIALHEGGHGLSQAHFGQLFRTDKNGKFHFAPQALMNAGYTGAQRELSGTDNGGHCSIWDEWPNY